MTSSNTRIYNSTVVDAQVAVKPVDLIVDELAGNEALILNVRADLNHLLLLALKHRHSVSALVLLARDPVDRLVRRVLALD